ncbi:citrulline utilization hydrolase CtlX [Mucilaginibacter jinjuensis]|uniref:Arginine deiminase-related protein n=1 Tax=Mucilaginibacter jinjuensis TaxID=1176721 RepID=A0ABY7T163_9SPHI|nr:arginine deiminase-related protein [Mucilaginibacter jinjuensis]WCT10074.1 arginine deiminase-related protein [Mucilaginibacter jinjuensis]
MNQSTSTILMIKPVRFGYNEQTAESNAFQTNIDLKAEEAQVNALKEFDAFVAMLYSNGVNVIVIDDTPSPHTPDSIFPNNWISFHDNGDILLYPMQAENRRLERRKDIIRQLEESYSVKHVIDLSHFEELNQFLEGTGSMVLDRINKIAYACLSPRTDAEVLEAFSKQENYKVLLFNSVDANNQPIYHTNVVMCIGTAFAVICLDSIKDAQEKQLVVNTLKQSGKEVIDITFEQMNQFAGNMLEVESISGEKLLVMSQKAYQSLTAEQVTILSKYARLIYADLDTIETLGGGSARCMLAEVHLPKIVA